MSIEEAEKKEKAANKKGTGNASFGQNNFHLKKEMIDKAKEV